MKFEIQPTPQSFKPVSLTIVMESQEELDRWGSVMNSSIYYVLNELGLIPDRAWELLESAGANAAAANDVVDNFIKKHIKD
jgi:hypothetical protein